jgi:hypothetical protein
VKFIYGLSPGLDIRFSSTQDRASIGQRFEQLLEAGCEHFALLFDDLPGELHANDRQAFGSVAAAQCAVSNDIYSWLRSRSPQGRFLFCPTPYCDRMDRWHLAGEGYLETVGQSLDATIDVLWTGPEIISREIPVESINALAARIGRAPLIWDNLHANDYDGRRLYTGPYSGRALELKQHVAGILSNPNTEFPINFIPLRTLGDYLRAGDNWHPREAYLAALEQWLPSYASQGDAFTLDDLTLLADCFYLPHADGPEANRLYDAVHCLVSQPVSQWGDAEAVFDALDRQVQSLFDKLTQLNDRELFYAWSRRAWDLKEELQLLRGFIAKKKAGETTPHIDSHLPGTYRGGFLARLQGLLSMDNLGRFWASEELT